MLFQRICLNRASKPTCMPRSCSAVNRPGMTTIPLSSSSFVSGFSIFCRQPPYGRYASLRPVQFEVLADSYLRCELFNCPGSGVRAHFLAQGWIFIQNLNAVGKLTVVSRQKQKTRTAIFDIFR